ETRSCYGAKQPPIRRGEVLRRRRHSRVSGDVRYPSSLKSQVTGEVNKIRFYRTADAPSRSRERRWPSPLSCNERICIPFTTIWRTACPIGAAAHRNSQRSGRRIDYASSSIEKICRVLPTNVLGIQVLGKVIARRHKENNLAVAISIS